MGNSRTTGNRSAAPADATAGAVAGFLDAQQQVLDRYRVKVEHRLLTPTIGGCAQVLVAERGHHCRRGLASVPGLGRALLSVSKPSTMGAEQMLKAVGEEPDGLTEFQDVLVAAQRVPTYAGSVLAVMQAVMHWTGPGPRP